MYGASLNATTNTTAAILQPPIDPAGRIVRSFGTLEFAVELDSSVDRPAEIARLKKEIERLRKDIESKQKRLADENFTSRAPAKVVDDLRIRLAERQIELQKLEDRLKQLEF